VKNKITKLRQNVLTAHQTHCLTLQEIFKLGITDKTLFTILFEIENFEKGQCTIQKICRIDMPPYVHLQYLLQMEKNINLQYLDGLEFMIQNKKDQIFIYAIPSKNTNQKMYTWENYEIHSNIDFFLHLKDTNFINDWAQKYILGSIPLLFPYPIKENHSIKLDLVIRIVESQANCSAIIF
jgi:hypothetical protein